MELRRRYEDKYGASFRCHWKETNFKEHFIKNIEPEKIRLEKARTETLSWTRRQEYHNNIEELK
jgi:hypothetical protein